MSGPTYARQRDAKTFTAPQDSFAKQDVRPFHSFHLCCRTIRGEVSRYWQLVKKLYFTQNNRFQTFFVLVKIKYAPYEKLIFTKSVRILSGVQFITWTGGNGSNLDRTLKEINSPLIIVASVIAAGLTVGLASIYWT